MSKSPNREGKMEIRKYQSRKSMVYTQHCCNSVGTPPPLTPFLGFMSEFVY